MIYSAIAHEVMTRLRWHAKPGGMLTGLNIADGMEFSVEGEDDLPKIAPTDMELSDITGKSSGAFTLFLRTSRERKFTSMDPKTPGLVNWLELVMDAVETPPSAPDKPDTRLIPHRADGTAIPDNNGCQLELLGEQFRWEIKMAQITDLSFLIQLSIKFELPNGRRAQRRAAPVTFESYQV